MSRIYNFNAGPAVLPLEVLEEAQRELIDFQGTGMSLLESSHRAKAYDAVHNEAIANLKRRQTWPGLIPEQYQPRPFLLSGIEKGKAQISLSKWDDTVSEKSSIWEFEFDTKEEIT